MCGCRGSNELRAVSGTDVRGLGDQFACGKGVGTRRFGGIMTSLSKTWNTKREPSLWEANGKDKGSILDSLRCLWNIRKRYLGKS